MEWDREKWLRMTQGVVRGRSGRIRTSKCGRSWVGLQTVAPPTRPWRLARGSAAGGWIRIDGVRNLDSPSAFLQTSPRN